MARDQPAQQNETLTYGLGFRVDGSEFRVQGFGFRVLGNGGGGFQ